MMGAAIEIRVRHDVFFRAAADDAVEEIEELVRFLRARNDELADAVAVLSQQPGAFSQAMRSMEADAMGTSNIQQAIDNLRTEVERNTSVDGSAIALLQSLAAQVEANKTDPAALQALVDQIRGSSDTLAAAVTANTPASEEPPADGGADQFPGTGG
jgi:hypothetical protein